MKPSMIFAIIMLTAIVLIVSFDLQLSPTAPIPLPEGVDTGNILYVCPAASSTWDSIANAMRGLIRPITIGFFFAGMVLLFVWAWALYQNLLKDKFDKSAFTNPWGFTKFLFWAIVVVTLAAATPNHFKSVHITGLSDNYVLCENNTPGARAVWSENVTR
ncbi:MAG: hypothetical protein K2M34_03800 [Alphaproteobacteria bacterium]|nr:hypothetical protein [Alphaproteobacteria bacterium]